MEERIQANPHYAYIRYPDDREDTVSVRHLAPTSRMRPQPEDPAASQSIGECHSSKGFSPPPSTTGDVRPTEEQVVPEELAVPEGGVKDDTNAPVRYEEGSQCEADIPQLRRSQRNRRPPIRYEAH